MTATLVLPERLADELASAARLDVETGAVLIAGITEAPGGHLRLTGQRLFWVPEHAYLKRERDQLLITSEGYVPALAEAERAGAMAFWVHTHPGGYGPVSSLYDDRVDASLDGVFRLRTGAPFYGALIVSPRGNTIDFTAKLMGANKRVEHVERLWIVGDRFRLLGAFDVPQAEVPDIFDRNVRAFGSDVQRTLAALHIGVVGAGGTGSAVCEQLVRLGVRRLTVIDADRLSESNVTRVYGSTPADVGRFKVDIAADHLRAIAPDLVCDPLVGMTSMEAIAQNLTDCDLVFGCTDDNAGRLVLSRLATFILTPVIDVGVLLSNDKSGRLSGIDGRVTVLSPGSACLVCRDRIDLARAAQELRTPEERKKLEDEGYAPALAGVEPAVVTFTTAVAAAAVSELLERLIGFGPEPRPSEILLRWHEREVSTNLKAPRPSHYCDEAAGKWGKGSAAPFLEQTWPSP